MNYQKQYENKINWQNKPSTSTPINATNLSKMDNALNYMDEKLFEAIYGGIVEANPSGSATGNLNKIGINGTVYGISGGGGGGDVYACLGIGKKKTVTNNVIDTDIDLHRAPIVGDRLLIYFDATVQNPTGLTTYNNGTAVTSNLEPVTPLYINGGWNILEFKNDGFLYNNCWVRMQNVPIPNNTLSGLSDTAIISPSDGQMLAYDNSSSKWKNKTIAANNGGTPVRELKTLQIGDAVFDAFGLKTFDVTSVTSGVNGAIAVDVITASQLNGEIIAVYTGSNTGSTGNAWTLALSDSQTVEALTMSKADGTAFTEALTANSLMFVKIDTSNDTAVVLGIVGAGSVVSGNGSGSPASYLNKLKIGSAIYDTSAIRPFSVSQIANNTVKIFVADIDQLDGKVIALSTGALTGTTSSAWSLNLVDTSGGAVSLDVSMLNADGTAFSDDISANELLFVAIDLTNYDGTILSVIGKSEDEIKTATGNPITLTDAIAGNAIEVSAEIVASQDLHGYDKPWVGGAGKNKIPLTVSALKSANTNGTWNGNVYVYGGVTFTVLTDSDDNVVGIKTDGAPNNGNISFYLTTAFNAVSGETYTISGSPSGKSYNTYRIFPVSSTAFAAGNRLSDDNAEDATRTAAGNETVTFYIQIFNGVNVDNKVFYPQIEIGTQATTFAPYSNICPITGFSSVVITDVDSESHTATVTVALGQTVYGGTLDLTSGELTVTHANIASYNGETIGEPWISSMDEYTEGGTPTTGAQVVYTLATPTTTTLTAAQVALVKGYNQLSCNSGDMEITYKASGLDALKERVDELEDRVDDVETALAGKANVEPYLEQSVTLSTSQTTTVTFTDLAFTANSVVDPAISVWGIFPEDVTVASGSCTVVMPKVSTAQTVIVGIFIKR